MTDVKVQPRLRVVANGFKGEDTLRLTVIATPTSGVAASLALDRWPSEMAGLVRKRKPPFRLWMRPIDGQHPNVADAGWKAVDLDLSQPGAYQDASLWTRIAEIWTSALSAPGAAWENLAKDIEKSMEGSKRTHEPKDTYLEDGQTEKHVADTLAADGSIAVNRPDSNAEFVVKAVLPVRQSDLTLLEETVRAARVLCKQYAGQYAVRDGTLDRLGDLQNERERFVDVVNATDPERSKSKQSYDEIKNILNGKPIGEDKNNAIERPSLIPEVSDVVAPDDNDGAKSSPLNRKLRATQEYGGWLQRRPDLKGTVGANTAPGEVDPPRVDDKRLADDGNAAKLMAMRGIYYSIQGDPTLSRLFCLTFDVEVSLAKLPDFARTAATSESGLNLHLLVTEGETIPAGITHVATAAKLHSGGFWPVSVFETIGGGAAHGRFVEQSDGFWLLGADEKGAPRYELASLDVRRSVDSKVQGRDRGEAHRTGGFAVLDRGRAAQITRDMALAEFNKLKLAQPNTEVVVLHAEELTIGRRVDVAAVAPGSNPSSLKWRSLMHRFVRFDFGKTNRQVETLLLQLMGGKANTKGLLEETSFQAAARFVPKTKGDGNITGVEAVAEEVIFQWDGTPVGVLTDGPTSRKSISSTFPFDRFLNLPGAASSEADLRPPPLRFGVPYVFRFRSMFLGGGSPPATTASGPGTAVPAEEPADGGGLKIAPRRHLRHEAIGAPLLLLPRHLAERSLAQMGYELADQAIVRSWNDEESGLDQIVLPDDVRGTYVEKSVRTTPAETIRVFVAPEAAYQIVAAHGKFDRADARDIRRGGLRDVSYTPRRNHGEELGEGDTKVRPSGFPVAVSTRRDSLDEDGVIYPRTVFPVCDAPERGIPVFEPGGRNTTRDGEVGYLPDPAVADYSIRARIAGSDLYLDGALSVPLYHGTSYPHALPLVVKVVRVAAVRPYPPEKIGDIAKPPVATTMDDVGSIPAKSRRRARVHYVEIALYQGEDFELEVSCLPDPDMLAGKFSVVETMAQQLNAASTDEVARKRLLEMCGRPVDAACLPGTEDSLRGLLGHTVPDANYRRKVAAKLLEAMTSRWPVEEIAAVTRLRVHHALNKPRSGSIAWWTTGEPALKSIRPKTAAVCAHDKESNVDAPEATDLLIDGAITLDLDLIESFQVIATTVATNGFQIDASDRGRSLISRRSGRWPVVTNPEGADAYAQPIDVVGFSVLEDGRVVLPREPVTLLNVANLPSTGAIGPLRVADKPDCKPAVFSRSPENRRMTKVELLPLFAAVLAGTPIEQLIARLEDAIYRTERKRALVIQCPHVFKDTLARRLTLDLVAVSRGATAFETAPSYVQGKEQALFRRQPLKRTDQALRAAATAEVWIKSTKVPASPDVRRPEPSFVFRRWATPIKGRPTIEHGVERRAMTRLYLGRGWFSSGEGERLGIVLWPPRYDTLDWQKLDANLVAVGERTIKIEDFQDRDLGPGGAFVTRWGGDPIRLDRSIQEGYLIPPSAFADLPRGAGVTDDETLPPVSPRPNPHRPTFVPSARMPIPKAATPKEDGARSDPAKDEREFLEVSLLTYEPCFDLDREEWYVDVDLRATRASEPFVRFGLVRYQEHAISDDLTTSEPVTLHIQLLPKRTVLLTVDPVGAASSRDHRVTIMVSGRGSRGIYEPDFDKLPAENPAAIAGWKASFDRLKLPKIRASVFHESGDAPNRLRKPVDLRGWDPTGRDDSLPLEMPDADVDGDPDLVWIQSFELAEATQEALGPGQVIIYLEEVDLRMPASYREEPITLAKMFDEKTFVTSGPRFSARIPFLEIK